MSLREAIGYGLLLILIGSITLAWLRWRRAVRADRLARWGTALSPRRAARANRRGEL